MVRFCVYVPCLTRSNNEKSAIRIVFIFTGSWNIDNCNRLQGVICKRGINASYDFTSTEPTTVMPGNCENGWYNLGQLNPINKINLTL